MARRDPRFAAYLEQGRSYGPHGREPAAIANFQARGLDFKAYMAPAISIVVSPLPVALSGPD